MQALVEELKQHALMVANEVKRNSNDETTVQKAYDRAKSFNGVICPRCWVNEEQVSELGVTATASQTKEYECKKCKFKKLLPNT